MAAEFVKLCCDGDLEGVRAALQSGVDVNSKGEDGYNHTGLMEGEGTYSEGVETGEGAKVRN